MCYVLVVGFFHKWYGNVSGYGKPVIRQRVGDGYSLSTSFLTTPHLRNFVLQRFNVPTEHEVEVIGLELEDGGGDGTAGSHPNERLYFSDVMQGRIYGPAYVSQIFLYSLKDSGWYDVNDSFYETLAYLDITNFPGAGGSWTVLIDPPQKSFPKDFQCLDSTQDYCFYDQISTGLCAQVMASQLPEDSKPEYNANIGWYNPSKNLILGQDDLLDYAMVLVPTGSCRIAPSDFDLKDAELHGETRTPNSILCYVFLDSKRFYFFV